MLEHGGEEEHGEGCPGLAGEELHAGGAAPTRAQVSLLFLAALLLQNPRQTKTASVQGRGWSKGAFCCQDTLNFPTTTGRGRRRAQSKTAPAGGGYRRWGSRGRAPEGQTWRFLPRACCSLREKALWSQPFPEAASIAWASAWSCRDGLKELLKCFWWWLGLMSTTHRCSSTGYWLCGLLPITIFFLKKASGIKSGRKPLSEVESVGKTGFSCSSVVAKNDSGCWCGNKAIWSPPGMVSSPVGGEGEGICGSHLSRMGSI